MFLPLPFILLQRYKFHLLDFRAAGLFHGIVLKYNSSGVLQWGYRFGSTLNDIATAIATDGISVYIAGKLLWKKQFATGLQNIDVSRHAQGIYLLKANGTAQKIFVE